jgi:predicted O-methyltransferase YrrM
VTDQAQWTAVDQYISNRLVGEDSALDAALRASDEAGLPSIAVAPNQGKFLQLLARMLQARQILEVGTLGGYSTIWLARALPTSGRVVTLESNAHHAEVARGNIVRAGLSDVVDVRVGPALDTLPALTEESGEPFDLTFIDADKASIPEYFEWALTLSRAGAVIVVDNVVRGGALIDEESEDAAVQGVRRFHDALADDPRVSATSLQTVGLKGYDGFTLAFVESGGR